MSEVYQSAFVGREKYFDELRNLEAQRNNQLVKTASIRREQLTEYLYNEVETAQSTISERKRSYAFPSLEVGVGLYLVYAGVSERNFFAVGFGCGLLCSGIFDARNNYLQNNPKLDAEIELSDEQKRYMYAKFMLQSMSARTEE